jgi:hypothetical protein
VNLHRFLLLVRDALLLALALGLSAVAAAMEAMLLIGGAL